MAINWAAARRQTAGGIPYELVEGYPTFEHTLEGDTAVEQYVIRASDVRAFVAESTPPPYILGNYVFPTLPRRMPGTLFLFTKSLSFQPHSSTLPGDPLGADTGAPAGTYETDYLVTINYTTVKKEDPDPTEPETFLEHSISIGGENYQVSNTQVKVDDGATAMALTDKEAPGLYVSVAMIVHTYKWPQVLLPNWDLYVNMLGKVNAAAQSVFNSAVAETILFESVSGSQNSVWNGASASVQPWNLSFTFKQRVKVDATAGNVTWNHCFVPNRGKWLKPYWTPTGTSDKKYMYETANLSLMFRT